MSYFFSITGDKFVINVPQDVFGYFKVLKSPYLRIGTKITYTLDEHVNHYTTDAVI